MEGFLGVDTKTNLPGSPTNSFLADEVASICPLITPSPPTNDLIHALPESSEANYAIGEELANILQIVKDNAKCGGDSASSSSSALAEPACTQLLNHRNVYHHMDKDEETIIQESNGKSQPLQLTFRNPPDNYFFMSWNWPLIRKISMWMFLACLVAMVALVIAMISSLPRKCNPKVEWYQGSVFYEIFPASFSDSNNGMTGDFIGISKNADYIMALGVKVVRLNSIFDTPKYPEDYKNVTSLIEIAKPLGNLDDFRIMVKHLKSRNISLVLDLPISTVVKKLTFNKIIDRVKNETYNEPMIEFLRSNVPDPVEEALFFWTQNGVEGFYLKGLESFVDDPNFVTSLRRWKKLIGFDRIFIINETVLTSAASYVLDTILNNVNLIDIRIKIELGVNEVSKQIESIENSTLFLKPGMPWVHWSMGDENTRRLANRLPFGNATLGALLLHFMLPGSPSLFYGDEIGLKQIIDSSGDRKDLEHLYQLGPMIWPNSKQRTFSWIHGEKTHINFDQVELLAKMTALRLESPSIYMNSVFKEGGNKANAEVKYSREDLLVIQRWYPRRKSYVVVSNLGDRQINADLSTLLYRGEVIVGPRVDSRPGSVSFKEISLWPGESVVTVLQ